MNITSTNHSGYTLNIGKTNKFKTVKIQLTFTNDLSEKNVTRRAILPYLLKATNRVYPTRKDFSIHLEELYAASFNAGVKKVGLAHQLVFDLTLIHNDYAHMSENLLEEGFRFLHTVFFDHQFTEHIFEEEKRLLDEYFLSIYGNKMRYAFLQCTNAMYQGETFQLQPLGRQEDLTTLTLEDCENSFVEMLNNDVINISVVGDVVEHNIDKLIQTYLPFTPREKALTPFDKTQKNNRAANTIIEHQEVQQAKLVMGFKYPIYYLDDDYYSAFLFNMILGGNPESQLFTRIREELNKVYFIASTYDQYKGSLLIYAGINKEDYDEVVDEIHKVIHHIQKKEISDGSMEIAKKSLINGLVESFDSSSSIASRINNLAMFKQEFDLDKVINQIHSVTKEDVAKCANLLTLDTTYLLRGEDHE